MKISYTTLKHLIFVSMLFFVAASCKKNEPIVEPEPDPNPEPLVVDNEVINRWTVDSMRIYYYWNQIIPGNNSLDFTKDPETFFEGILSPDDRFSWIQDADELQDNLSGVTKTTGMSIALTRLGSSDDVIAVIRYVLKDSPADQLGLKRGDILTQFNGSALTVSNYNTVFAGSYYRNEPYTVTVARLQNNTIYNDRTITLIPIEFQEHAVHKIAVINTTGGSKVGYIFYNRFLNNQANALVDSIAKLKGEGINDLILDLRYNGGGGVFVAAILSGLIHTGFDETSPFLTYVYNSNFRSETRTYAQTIGSSNVNIIKSNNLNLPRIFILATGSSASASELVINNLRPFLGNANVVHIGRTTVGKNEGSITIRDQRSPRLIDWALQPIVMKIANKEGFGDYPNGLAPTYDVNEWDVFPFVAIGSKEDPLVARALSIIDPSMSPVSSLSSRVMSARGATSGTLRVHPVEGFEDKTRPFLPIDVNDNLDHERIFKEMQ